MPFKLEDLQRALQALVEFKANAVSLHHERYSFPFFEGSYFSYRKVDVLRVVAIAKSISSNPRYLDVGCAYGDFLKRVREFLPNAEGIEKDARIFYGLGIVKPDYIRITDAYWIDRKYDLIFVGWMEPGQDFRDPIARSTEVIVTTLDQGISLAAEFDGHGFQLVAWWRTPSWEDVNTEIMNKYYTKMPEGRRVQLAKMRGAHNLWYVYASPQKVGIVKEALKRQVQKELSSNPRYSFESVLDECGYGYLQNLENAATPEPLWQVQWN
ncbi:MAG: class I SAM-dependent methyltransferase [Thermoproteota archaeon]|nr:class I SAM-dependent methyltransferase [Thermoproteota archaeon]